MEDPEVRTRGQGGFTLIEMLIVMVILAILSTLARAVTGIGAARGNVHRPGNLS